MTARLRIVHTSLEDIIITLSNGPATYLDLAHVSAVRSTVLRALNALQMHGLVTMQAPPERPQTARARSHRVQRALDALAHGRPVRPFPPGDLVQATYALTPKGHVAAEFLFGIKRLRVMATVSPRVLDGHARRVLQALVSMPT